MKRPDPSNSPGSQRRNSAYAGVHEQRISEKDFGEQRDVVLEPVPKSLVAQRRYFGPYSKGQRALL